MIQHQSDRMGELMKEEFEDTKGVIRIGKSKKNRQHNGQNNLGTNHLTCRGGLWFFVSFRNCFSENTRVRIFFFCRAKREFFFQNVTLGFMTKTLNPIICLPPPKSEYLFQQHWESEYFFRKKP